MDDEPFSYGMLVLIAAPAETPVRVRLELAWGLLCGFCGVLFCANYGARHDIRIHFVEEPQ